MRGKTGVKIVIGIVLATLVLGSLVACGKKPGSMEPPAGVSKADFPRTYPDIKTDPLPSEDK